jgi:hypothetical protein
MATPGEANTETVFEYHEEDDLIWARYSGGAVRLGYLVGTRDGDTLDFRYSQLSTSGETANGHCRTKMSLLLDGRIRFDDEWAWESKPGEGKSVHEEDRH